MIAVIAGEALGRAIGKLLHIKLAERVIYNAVAIRRHAGGAHHFAAKTIRCHVDREARWGDDLARVGHMKGNVTYGAACNLNTVDLAARPEYHGRIIGRPTQARENAFDAPDFFARPDPGRHRPAVLRRLPDREQTRRCRHARGE